ncbi:double-strand-break repair protein rad21-like protein 1 [Tiliqua scincoides]|uniref:double-strand-break repair protein rad21-like protein 1 n=1 Tax=Tiliqua scincoides TaxID=71010 RepID=UPI003461A792
MFYMQLLMNKRGPLAKIWLAAHWDKKVTKAHVFECNLEIAIAKILSPKFKMALRTSGHLLLGVVRIYHRKTKYLLADCNEALLKMQSEFRPGLVDLPKGTSEANYDTITLPEDFHDFDTQLPDVNAIDVAQHFTLYQSRAEDITLIEEDYRQHVLLHGDSFGDETEMPRQSSFFSDTLLASSSGLLTVPCSLNFTGDEKTSDEDILNRDGFGDEGVARDMIDDLLGAEQNSLITDLYTEGEIALPQQLPDDDQLDYSSSKQKTKHCQMNETTLLSNEEEGFVLDPIDDSVLIRKQRGKRKRKLLVDAMKELNRATMQKQLLNYEDTMTTLDIAPPTRKLMILQELGGVDKLFNRPTMPLINEDLQMLFARCLGNERKTLQQDVEVEERNKNHNAQEGPGVLQDTGYPEAQTALQNGGGESAGSVTLEAMFQEAVDMASFSDSSLLDPSVRQEAEMEQTTVENELQGTNIDNEEMRSKRTLELLNMFQQLHRTEATSFSFLALCKNKNRNEVASMFHSLLVLRKQLAVKVAQVAPYADIVVTVGPRFLVL